MTWPNGRHLEELRRIVQPAREGSVVYLMGFVELPVWRCLRCEYSWIGHTWTRPKVKCKKCKDPNWYLPRLSAPRRTNRSKNDKRTLA